MFAVMLVMGAFASIYHPAGLALLSHCTTPTNRPRALGLHGIIGSAGIGGAPLMAWTAFEFGCTWRMFYLLLAVPGVILSAYFLRTSAQDREQVATAQSRVSSVNQDDDADWASFFLLACIAALQGLIYSAIMSFLPRFLSTPDDGSVIYVGLQSIGLIDATGSVDGRFVASLVLLCGCVGQFVSGRLARPEILERQLAFVFLATVPFLLWMSIAAGTNRMIAMGVFATIYFMHQPIYSSLIAKYSPPARRSLSYGFGFAMAFGVGSFGASFGGFSSGPTVMYGVLTCIAIVAGALTMVLAWMNRAPSR